MSLTTPNMENSSSGQKIPNLYPVQDWLILLDEEIYEREPKGLLRRGDNYSAVGLYLQLSGVEWIEHPNSPDCYYPAGAQYYTCSLPKRFLADYGLVGELYRKKFHYFSQIASTPFRTQARQIRLLIELDARRKVRQHERKLHGLQEGD